MTDQTIPPELVSKRADQLVVGDRIVHEFLPSPYFREPGEVVYVKVHDYRKGRYVFVAYMQDNGFYDSTSYEPDGEVAVYPADTGLSYSRADDGDLPQPVAGRVPPHFENGRTELPRDLREENSSRTKPRAIEDCHGPQPIAVDPHLGHVPLGVGDRGGFCNGAPDGFEADCGVPGAHGPHPL